MRQQQYTCGWYRHICRQDRVKGLRVYFRPTNPLVYLKAALEGVLLTYLESIQNVFSKLFSNIWVFPLEKKSSQQEKKFLLRILILLKENKLTFIYNQNCNSVKRIMSAEINAFINHTKDAANSMMTSQHVFRILVHVYKFLRPFFTLCKKHTFIECALQVKPN